MSLSLAFHRFTTGQPDVRPAASMPIPMVYENVPLMPPSWEYRVLTIDTREEALPDSDQLNELGREGWLLVGIVDQQARVNLDHHSEAGMTLSQIGMLNRQAHVHYYFVRQKME